MIKNVGALIFLLVAGCKDGPPTRETPGFQGVVEYEERVLSFEVAGKIEKVNIARGDHVEPGATLAQVEDTLERLSRDAKKDELEVAKADLALVNAGSRQEDIAQVADQVRGAKASEALLVKALERSRSLVTSGSVAQAELDRSSAELDRATYERKALEQRLALLQRGSRREEVERAKAHVEAAESALALEEARLARHEVRTNQGGIVLDVHVERGELASPGTPVATVADVARPYVEVFVPEAELAGIKVGVKAEVRTDAHPAPLPAVVEHVATRAEFTPRFLFSETERPNLVIRVRVRVDDPRGELHAGTPAFARIVR
jgi:HlyD family secretion protein